QNGTGSAARFNGPTEITCDGTNLYVTDEGNQVIRMIAPGGVVTALSGSGSTTHVSYGLGTATTFYEPFGIAADKSSGFLYVGDMNNYVKKAAYSVYTITPDLPA